MRRWWMLAALAGLAMPGAALARPAQCYVEVDGLAVIDGSCDFVALDGAGSFQVASPKGDTFAQVDVERPGLGDGSWNGGGWAGHAHAPLGRLARNDACWSNEAATVCAW